MSGIADSVFVVDGETNAVVNQIEVVPNPTLVAVNPETSRTYVTDARDFLWAIFDPAP